MAMVDVEERAGLRLAALVRQLSEEYRAEKGRSHGEQVAIAKRLGISQPYVSQILKGDRSGAGLKSVEQAIQNLGLSREYFFGTHRGTPHYKTFLQGERVDAPSPYPALAEFLGTPMGQQTTEEERAHLNAYRASHGEPTVMTFQLLLQAYQSEIEPDAAAESAEVTESATASALKKGGRHLRGKE